MSRNEPLESEALTQLINRLADDPDNENLKKDIRNLDLLARKAYFTSQWQVKTGGWILFSGAVVLAVAIWFNRKLLSKIEEPAPQESSLLPSRLITQKWLLITGGSLLIVALIASFFSNDYLEIYLPEVDEPQLSATQIVEVIRTEKIENENLRLTAEDSPDIPVTPIDPTENTQTDLATVPAPVIPEKKSPLRLTAEIIKNQHNTFRGPFSHGISYKTNIPVDWNGKDGVNVLWKTHIPKPGYNSPVIWDDRIFLSGADETSRAVYCIDMNSGKIIWEKDAAGITGSPSALPDVTDDTGLAAPSLAVDGTGVYAIFGTGDVIAFDMEGKQLWSQNLGVPDNHYGHSSSLLVWDNKLFIQYDTNRGGRLLALTTSTGETAWDVRRSSRISWASPILIFLDGKYQVVTSSEPLVAAHDPETGREIWSVNCMMGEVGPSPAFSEGLVFAANEYATLAAIQPGENPVILWNDNEYLPEVSSPVAYNGLLFIATSYGVIACYDMRSGEKYWEHDTGRGFYSSPVIAENKLYVIDLGGNMYIFNADKEKILTGQPLLGENVYATPAFSDGKIIIRGENNLFCIGVKR